MRVAMAWMLALAACNVPLGKFYTPDGGDDGGGGSDAGNDAPSDGPPVDGAPHVLEQEEYFKAAPASASIRFGWTVALSADGQTMAVGAPEEDRDGRGVNPTSSSTANDAGAVFVFGRASNGAWTQHAYIKASNTEAGDRFGAAIALSADGSTLAVGADDEDSAATGIDGTEADNTAASSGAVYVFTRTGTNWGQQAYVKASNTNASDRFATSLALSADGSTLAVGALGESSNATGVGATQSNNGAFAAGAAYVFTRTGTTWSQQAYVKASNTGAGDQFGKSIGLSADGATLAVGAMGEKSIATGVDGLQTDNSADFAGATYVFTRTGSLWSQQAYLKASNTAMNDLFGSALSLSGNGDTLAVIAHGEDSAARGIDGNQADNLATNSGAIYVFARSGTTWSQQAYVKASNTDANDELSRVALSGDGSKMIAGSYFESSPARGLGGGVGPQADDSLSSAGACYLFARTGTTWAQETYIKPTNTEGNMRFGFGVAISSDGTTLAAGAPQETSSSTGVGGNQTTTIKYSDSGAAYVFR